jgi:CRISPR-associated protein Csm2
MNNNEIKTLKDEMRGFSPLHEAARIIDFTKPFDSELLDFTRKFGFFLCDIYFNENRNTYEASKNSLSNSQIRNFFGEVKRIQMTVISDGSDENWFKIKSAFLLIKPKLAYSVGRIIQRNQKSKINEFGEVFSIAIDKVKADEPEASVRFMRFVDFFEAVLAYHKSFGGSEN